ncbi:MAG: hypothetical protein HKN37_07660 [Rhodothermales bacterium]|nr:hypothetical protein [Rhodothermales bacterium]
MKRNYLTLWLSGLVLVAAVGCDSSANDESLSASEDVAESLAKLVAEDTGGLVEQAGDIMDLASVGDIQAQTAAVAGKQQTDVIERSYDPETGTWTISVSRERGDAAGDRYMSLQKVYEVQFLDASGDSQRFFVTQGDTAHAISFVIVEGSISLTTPHVSALRDNITGSWMATGVNTDIVTLNGTYARSGGHTITHLEAVRTLDYDLALEVEELVGPKGSRRDLSQKLSGTVSGQYDAFATFERGDAYREREISREFTVTISEGEATIVVNGDVYAGNVRTGDLAGR